MINFLDIIIILLFFWKGWRGLNNGVIIELGKLIILYLSFFIAMNENNIISHTMANIINMLNLSPDFKWIFSFILIYLILFFLLRLIHNAIDSLSLGLINKILGGVFGIIKCWLILNLLIFILLFVNEKSPINTEKHIFKKELVRNSFFLKIMCHEAGKYIGN